MKTVTKKDWVFNEFIQVGTDYNDVQQIEIYDARMRTLRDIDKEIDNVLHSIDLKPGHRILEIGCGTGEFTVKAASICTRVTALDISIPMLEYAANKAEKAGVTNIDFVNKGFLTYEHQGKPYDAVVTSLALHHLPDFWKMVALKRIYNMLRPGGVFYLHDVIYSFDYNAYEDKINKWIDTATDENMAIGMKRHVGEEFSTTRWIMEHLLKNAGFYIQKIEFENELIMTYVCKKCLEGD